MNSRLVLWFNLWYFIFFCLPKFVKDEDLNFEILLCLCCISFTSLFPSFYRAYRNYHVAHVVHVVHDANVFNFLPKSFLQDRIYKNHDVSDDLPYDHHDDHHDAHDGRNFCLCYQIHKVVLDLYDLFYYTQTFKILPPISNNLAMVFIIMALVPHFIFYLGFNHFEAF